MRVSCKAGWSSRRAHVPGMTPTAAALARKSTRRGVKEERVAGGGVCESVARIVVSDAVSTAEEGARRARRPALSRIGTGDAAGERPRRLGSVADTPDAAAVSTRPHIAEVG